MDGNAIVSKFLQTESNSNHGILGVNEDNVLAVNVGDGDMVEAVKIVEQYKTVNSTYESSLKGLCQFGWNFKDAVDDRDGFKLDSLLTQMRLFFFSFDKKTVFTW